MIVISPAVVRPYAPSATPIAGVTLFVQCRELAAGNVQLNVQAFLWTAEGQQINVGPGLVRPMNAAEGAAWMSDAGLAGETELQAHERRVLPYLLAAYDLAPTAAAPATSSSSAKKATP